MLPTRSAFTHLGLLMLHEALLVCAQATLAGGWAITNYQISTRYGAHATLV